MNNQHVTQLAQLHMDATKRSTDPAVHEDHQRMWDAIATIAAVVLQVLKAQPR